MKKEPGQWHHKSFFIRFLMIFFAYFMLGKVKECPAELKPKQGLKIGENFKFLYNKKKKYNN